MYFKKKMAPTPFLGIILLFISPQVFTSGDHSVVLGTSVVLRPDDAVRSINSITWRQDGRVVANWFKGKPTSCSFKGRCSLNTTTGELTINNVTLEDGGDFTAEINGNVLPALVLSPVPKPTNPEETNWSLNSTFNRTADLGNVFRTPDDRRVTEDSKEETIVSNLNNSNSSNGTSHNYLLTVGLPVGLSFLIVVGLVWTCLDCCKGYQKISRFFRRRNEPGTSADAGHHPEEASKGHQEDNEMTRLNVEQQRPPGDQAPPPPTCNGSSSHSMWETPSSLNPEMLDGEDVSRDSCRINQSQMLVRVDWGS